MEQMKVLILTHGSRGDVQPFVGLAHRLCETGHTVIMGAPCAYKEATLHLTNSEFFGFDDALALWMTMPGVLEAFESNFRGFRNLATIAKTIPKVRNLASVVFDEMATLAKTLQSNGKVPDIVVHHVDLPGNEIAELFGTPAIPVCLQPAWVPTSSFPNPEFPFRIHSRFNRASYIWTRMRLGALVGGTTRWRMQELRLPYRRGHRNFLYRPDGKPASIMQAFSRHLLPDKLDYANHVHTTGFWHLPVARTWTPSESLKRFLSHGEPPICISFGSMVRGNTERIGQLVLNAVRRAGVRAVIVTGWGGVSIRAQRGDILTVTDVPFDWLFQHVSAVIHHGGSGTTGSASRSGKPQVACPIIYDQKFYGERLNSLGVAPPPLDHAQLTEMSLAEAISIAVSDRGIRVRAAELGSRILAEDGLARAVEVIEAIGC